MLFTKPTPPEDALKFANKVLVGSPLKSSEWQDVPAQLRTRAFFSSQVESVQVLQRARNLFTDFLAGNLKTTDDGKTLLSVGSRAAFVDQMQEFLAANGIERTDGGVTDLASEKRLGLIFDVQTRQAQDFGYYKQGMDADVLNEFPAQRFIRVQDVKEPRQSHAQYENQVYLKTDPIWARVINADFGVPFGPWGWGCGHDVEDVDRDEAESLGLIKPGERIQPPKENFNDNLRASAKSLDPDLIEKLKGVFGDQVIFENDTMRWRGDSALPAASETQPTILPLPGTSARTSPVSAAVNIAVTRTAETVVKKTLSLIDQVHDDGKLKPLTLDHHVSRGAQGTYYGGANKIGIRRNGAIQREMTIAHEIGHWLDDVALPGFGYSSQSSAELKEWRDAIAASRAVKNLQTMAGYKNNPVYRSYVLRTRELWARSYAQYIATRSGDATMLQQVESIIGGRAGGFWVDSQWTAEDFKPIAEAIDKLFKRLNWI